MIYNVNFICEDGNYSMKECKNFLKEKDIISTAYSLNGVGCGKLKQIVIDIIEL